MSKRGWKEYLIALGFMIMFIMIKAVYTGVRVEGESIKIQTFAPIYSIDLDMPKQTEVIIQYAGPFFLQVRDETGRNVRYYAEDMSGDKSLYILTIPKHDYGRDGHIIFEWKWNLYPNYLSFRSDNPVVVMRSTKLWVQSVQNMIVFYFLQIVLRNLL